MKRFAWRRFIVVVTNGYRWLEAFLIVGKRMKIKLGGKLLGTVGFNFCVNPKNSTSVVRDGIQDSHGKLSQCSCQIQL